MESSPLACKSGIYAITHIASGRQYIGSTVYITRRWGEHRRFLRESRHHSTYLQRAWLKFGPDAFSFTVLEYVPDKTKLIEREQFYLDTLHPAFNINSKASGANITPEAYARRAARKLTDAQIAASRRNVKLAAIAAHTPETAAKIGAQNRGRKQSDEHRRKISEALRGRTLTVEHRKHLSGRTLTAEHRKHLSDALMGRAGHPPQARSLEALRLGNTPEMRAKAKATLASHPPTEKQLAYWHRRKTRLSVHIYQPSLWS